MAGTWLAAPAKLDGRRRPETNSMWPVNAMNPGRTALRLLDLGGADATEVEAAALRWAALQGKLHGRYKGKRLAASPKQTRMSRPANLGS